MVVSKANDYLMAKNAKEAVTVVKHDYKQMGYSISHVKAKKSRVPFYYRVDFKIRHKLGKVL